MVNGSIYGEVLEGCGFHRDFVYASSAAGRVRAGDFSVGTSSNTEPDSYAFTYSNSDTNDSGAATLAAGGGADSHAFAYANSGTFVSVAAGGASTPARAKSARAGDPRGCGPNSYSAAGERSGNCADGGG